MSDLGESPTLRDAIASAIGPDFRLTVFRASLIEDVEDAVNAWLAARELVVPSPQPGAEEVLFTCDYYDRPHKLNDDRLCRNPRAVSPLPETET